MEGPVLSFGGRDNVWVLSEFFSLSSIGLGFFYLSGIGFYLGGGQDPFQRNWSRVAPRSVHNYPWFQYYFWC